MSSMETITYKVELPDPYQNAYERVIMEFEHRMRSREMEGIEAALKEHGYVKERTCRNVDDFGDNVGGWRNWETDGFGFTCSECNHVLHPDEMGASPLAPELLAERVKISYCPNYGAKVVC